MPVIGRMNTTLVRATVALVATTLLVVGSAAVFARRRDVWAGIQLLGSVCLVIVVFTHICEALAWFPLMGFGLPHSIGHYIDLSSAVLGVILIAAGWLKTRAIW